jgi:4-amino-4-deoxy-L-arabinose transferase-like glycosyltransferase
MSKKSVLILIFITIFGLLLRLISLTIGFELQTNLNTSIFPDEASFLVYAKYIMVGETPSISTSYHGSLILSSIIAFLFMIFGTSAILGRMVSVILGTLTIIVVYYFSKDLFNEKIAITSAFLIAISSILRFWSLRALSDSPLTFFFTLSIYLFYKGIKTEKMRWFILAGISSTITFLIKYPGFLIFIIIVVYFLVLIFRKKTKHKRRIFLNFLLTIGIFMLTAIFLLLSQFAVAYQPFLQITDYIQGLFGFNNPFFYVLYPLSLNIGYGIMILIVLAAVLIYSLIKSNDALLLLLIWCGVIFIFFSFYGGSELYRYLLPAFPALYIIIANFFINTINSNLKYFKIPNKIFRKIVMIGLIGGLIAFVGLETYVGEYFIVRRSKTYQGVYNSSNWLLSNVNSSDNIMAPSNSLSQLEFYTQSIFDYYSL